MRVMKNHALPLRAKEKLDELVLVKVVEIRDVTIPVWHHARRGRSVGAPARPDLVSHRPSAPVGPIIPVRCRELLRRIVPTHPRAWYRVDTSRLVGLRE